MDTTTFKDGFKVLCFNYERNKDQETDEFQKYLALELKDVPNEQFLEGVQTLVNTRKYPSFPTIGEIKDACIGDTVDPYTAWIEVDRIIRNGGIKHGTEYSHPIITMAVQSVGVDYIKNVRDSDMGFVRNSFISAFKSMKTSYLTNKKRFESRTKIIGKSSSELMFKDGKLVDNTQHISKLIPQGNYRD